MTNPTSTALEDIAAIVRALPESDRLMLHTTIHKLMRLPEFKNGYEAVLKSTDIDWQDKVAIQKSAEEVEVNLVNADIPMSARSYAAYSRMIGYHGVKMPSVEELLGDKSKPSSSTNGVTAYVPPSSG